MKLSKIVIKNHNILGNIEIDLINKKTNSPYQIVAFVGENGCGKTTLLNELFNYNESKYIEKQCDKEFISLFLRQNSLYTLSQNELVKVISRGETPFPINKQYSLNENNNIQKINANSYISKSYDSKDIVSLFNDETIYDAYVTGKINGIKCGGEALKLINGDESEVDLTLLSSGQQEVLLKINVLQNMLSGTDYILFDEPETSLHPRWQRIIIKFFKELCTDCEGETPQIFIATHSEKVLESLLEMDNVLLIRFSKSKNDINVSKIDLENLYLPRMTFSEINYSVFNISSFEYHNQLFSYLMELIKEEKIYKVDNFICNHKLCLENTKYKKLWVDETKIVKSGNHSEYNALPTYIRNYFHHLKDGAVVTEEELKISIDLLQKIIKEIKNKILDD